MTAMIATRAAALSATLAALHDGFAQGRSADHDLQVTLLAIAREQAADMSRYADLPPPRSATCHSARTSTVVPFRR